MIEFPDALFDRLGSGDVVLCTGVGFAATSGMPAWGELLSKMSDRLGDEGKSLKPLIEGGNYLTAAGYLKRKLGSDSLGEILTKAYQVNGAALPATYQVLGKIPFHAAVSTGYDDLIVRALGEGGEGKVYSYTDGPVLRLADDLRRFVVKAHGDVRHPDRLVLTRLDYKRFIGPNHAYRAFIEDLYRSHTLLFVGYHASDPDFLLFLDRLMAGFRDAVSDHYAILPGLSAPEAEELYANYRVRVISYDEGADPGKALADVLEEFGKAWQSKAPSGEEVENPLQWLKRQLGPVEERIDVVAGEGLSIPEGRLGRIRDTAAGVDISELDASSLCRLGNVRLYLGEPGAAIECYQAALANDEKLAAAHLNLHHAKAEAREYTEALDHLKKAEALDESLRVVPKRYDLRAVIGRGTTGTVYHAHDTEKSRDVTVKVLRVSYVKEHVSPERWLQETEALTRLEHPNIARVYDALIEGGRCILVTESLSGHSVDRQLRENGPMAPEQATKVVQQVCQGLEHAHAQGVLHLDVMPSNIFLRDDGTVALMDFRSGRAQKGRHVTVKKGSEGFQAPELLAGAGADARADVYSLGATLYTMLTVKVPIGSFPRLSEINPAARRFESLVTRALRAVPDERPSSIAEFAKHLAGSSEAVTLPEREDDLAGWLEVLAYQPDNEHALSALSKMEQGYRDQRDWDNLVTMLLGRVEIESDSDSRVSMLREVARIFELEVGDLGKAFAALSAAFREEHSSVEIRRDLERLAAATGMWNELLGEYTQLVQTLRDPKVACDWWVRMGSLYANELGHDDYAIAAFGQALALDANRADALTELAEVVKRKGDHKEYARLLSRQAQLEANEARRAELLKELGRTYAKELGSDEQAIAAYLKVLEVDRDNKAALDALEALYSKSEMWDELAELLRRLCDESDVAEEQSKHRRRLAELLADKLGRSDEAIALYEAVLAADPDDVATLKSLERLYDAAGRNEDYLKILDQRIAAAASADEKIALYRRLASEWEEQSGGKRRAAEYLERAAELGGGNEETYRALVRLYWELKDFPALASAYRAQIDATEAPAARVSLYAGLGKVYDEHLQDPPRAIETYEALLDAEPGNRIALAALARLHQAAEAWPEAVARLEQLAEREESVDAQVECYHQIGKLLLEHLGRADDAEPHLVKALELRDDFTPALLTLAQLYRERKDFGKAARLLREGARSTANELEKVERFYNAGITYLDDLGDEAAAVEVFEELLAVDPEHVGAGERLLPLYKKRLSTEELPAKARPVLEMLVRKVDSQDRAKAVSINVELGDVMLALGEGDRALEAYRRAHEIDPTASSSLSRLAEQLYLRKDHEAAGKLYQALLVHRRDSMESNEIVKVFVRLGEIKSALGEESKALNMFEKALDVDPTNSEVLDRLVSAYQAKGDQEAVLRAKKAQLRGLTDEEDRLRALEEIGDVLAEELNRPKQALSYYEQALAKKPDLRRVLHKVMEVQSIQKNWHEALDALKRLEQLENDPAHSYRLHYTAAIILRDELNKPKEAGRHFDLALEQDPTNRRAFDALKELFTAQGNFEGLAKAYRRMLKRLPETTPLEEQVQLWHELGTLCQDKMKDARGAIVAFEVAARLDPSDVARQENLGQLYASAGPDAYEKAIMVHQRLLRHDPMRLEAYKELLRLYAELGQRDKTWCVTAVLSLLKRAEKEEQAVYAKYRPKSMRKVSRKISDDIWRDYICHDKQRPILSELLAAVAPVIAPMAVRPRSSFGLKAGQRLDPAEDKRAYARAFDYAAGVIDQRPDELYLRADLKQSLELAMAGDAKNADLLLWVAPRMLDDARSERELVYAFARTLTLARRAHLLSVVTPSPNVLQAVVLAMVKLVDPGVRVSGDVDEIEKLAEVLRADLPPARVTPFSRRADELRAVANERVLTEWLGGVDLTASRAALILCDDLETAAKLVVDDPMANRELTPKMRLAELMRYAVSEEYFKVRELLGLQVS